MTSRYFLRDGLGNYYTSTGPNSPNIMAAKRFTSRDAAERFKAQRRLLNFSVVEVT